jgi:uncharacterized protein YjdB
VKLADETLTATADSEITGTSTVTWESSNENVATVNSSGKVTAVDVGEAVITATCGDYQAICVVTVTAS